MAIQHPFSPRAPLDPTSKSSNNNYRIPMPVNVAVAKSSLQDVPVNKNIGLIAGLGLALIAILGILFYYGYGL